MRKEQETFFYVRVCSKIHINEKLHISFVTQSEPAFETKLLYKRSFWNKGNLEKEENKQGVIFRHSNS